MHATDWNRRFARIAVWNRGFRPGLPSAGFTSEGQSPERARFPAVLRDAGPRSIRSMDSGSRHLIPAVCAERDDIPGCLRYRSECHAATSLNFNASFLISYIMLVMLSIDWSRENPWHPDKRFKLGLFVAATAYIIIVLQLLRGDRESSGLIAGLTALYLTDSKRRDGSWAARIAPLKRLGRVAVPASVVVCVFIVLGFVRSTAENVSLSLSEVSGMLNAALVHNTWTGVSLTNLGMAAEYEDGAIEYLYGKTYFQYVMSLPPGVVTQSLGIRRPFDGEDGPNWWYEVAGGGIHPVVVPFKNFGIVGVFAVLMLYGGVLCFCELRNVSGVGWHRLLYGSVATSSFLWFWYGDMNIVRGVIAAYVVWFCIAAW